MYRLFVAVDPPGSVRSTLGRLCYGLPGAKWFHEDQMHITIRFIGEVDGAALRDAHEALAEIRAEPFSLTVKGVGFFPPRKTPDTLWAGIEESAGLRHLRRKIESALTRAGLGSKNRKFAPHIGLARLKETPSARLARFLAENALLKLEPFPINEFYLYSSFLSSERALHQIEAAYPLNGKRSEET